MKIKASSYFLIAILIFTIPYIASAYTMETVKMKLVPLIMGGLIFILTSIQLAIELLQSSNLNRLTNMNNTNLKKGADNEAKKYVIGFLWLGAFVLFVYIIGFSLGTGAFIFILLKFSKVGWFKSASTSFVAALSIYLIFEILLKTNLFPGVFFGGHF